MVDSERRASLLARFRDVYGGEPRTFRAPGRVNLIGEHTDYNDGFVLPVAIDRDMLFAARARDDRLVRLHSQNFNASSEFSLDDVRRDEAQPWSNYVRGVALYLERELGDRAKELKGMDAVISGNVPVASGLSSSAALEVGTATTLLGLAGLQIDGVRKALLCQAAENKFVGVNCGIMDQYISALGRAGHALLIDCRSLAYELVPLSDAGYRVVVADTTVRRGLAGSEYNVRRSQCEEAVRILAERLNKPIKALRDVTPEDLTEHAAALPEVVRKRALHVVGENARTLDAVAALRAGDLKTFGRLMDESHESLRDLYGVSSPELDALVAAAQVVDGVLGARMTGAGFGGCAVALVHEAAIGELEERVGREYQAKMAKTALFYVCQVTDGAAEI